MTFGSKPHLGNDKPGTPYVPLERAAEAGQHVDVERCYPGLVLPPDPSVEEAATLSEAPGRSAGSIAAVEARSFDAEHLGDLPAVSDGASSKDPGIPFQRQHGRQWLTVEICLISTRSGASADDKDQGLHEPVHAASSNCGAPTGPLADMTRDDQSTGSAKRKNDYGVNKAKKMFRNKPIARRLSQVKFQKPIKLWSMTPVIKPKRDEI